MSTWVVKTIIMVSTALLIVVPATVHRRDRKFKSVKSAKGPLERVLLALVSLSLLPTLLWVMTPALAFADYRLRLLPFAAGLACLALGLWLLYRSHVDLGSNWSITLQVQEEHQLVTHGVYRHIRHPMYLALILYASGQTLILPNWLAGPAYLVAVTSLFILRVGPEERMMREQFGRDYETYMSRTKRLVPGVW
jgi:protein-S-isoprenylcysteine O-methyltransferase Ste14